MGESLECDLRIVRGSQFIDAFRRYKIFVNDKLVGTIARGQSVDFKVPAGSAVIEAKLDWAKGKPLVVEASPGKVTTVEVVNEWPPYLALWAITFGRDSYLVLREKAVA